MSELARFEEQSLAPAHVAESALVSEEQYQQAKKHFELLRRFISEQLVEGEDYGYIYGKDGKPLTDKPLLFKSGAEKLLALLQLTPQFELVEHEDWEKGWFLYKATCRLISKSGRIVAEGHGVAHSREKKYRSDKVDVYDLPNVLTKMAKKRALIDAIRQAGAGLFFGYSEEGEDEELDAKDLQRFWATVKGSLRFSDEEVHQVLKEEYGWTSVKQIPKARLDEVIGRFAVIAAERSQGKQKQGKLMEGGK